MGIDGLLMLLKPITNKMHISSFKGKTLGVDILPWLYKGCYSDIMKMDDSLLLKQQQSNISSCSQFLLTMINMLQENEIKMIAVYDGRSLQMKGQTVKKRETARKAENDKSVNLIMEKDTNKARKHKARGIRIAQPVILQSMRILKTKNIPFLVAPYQSDCQLAKMRNLNMIDAVVTEDSDLLVYGCNVIYKLDEEGMCQYLDLSQKQNIDCAKIEDKTAQQKQKQGEQVQNSYVTKFIKMSNDEKIGVCVLAGCDYVGSIKGVGIKKAIKMMDNDKDIMEILRKFKIDRIYGDRVPDNYQQKVINAITIFKHALTYNHISKTMQPLTPITHLLVDQQKLDKVIGEKYNQYLQQQVYNGKTTARTLLTRCIQPVQLKQYKQVQVQSIKLADLKQKISLQIDEESSSSPNFQHMYGNSQYEDYMIQELKSGQNNKFQPVLWPAHQNLVNQCIMQIYNLNQQI